MGTLVMLLLYGALIGGAWYGVHTFLGSYEAKGAAAQLAKDKPLFDACQTDRDTAIKANQGLQGDVKRIGQERDEQSAAVRRLSDLATAAKAQRERDLAAAKARPVPPGSDEATLTAALGAARTKGVSCEATLATIDDNLRTLARDRVREPGPGPGSDGRLRGADAPAGRGPGPDLVPPK